MRNGGKTVNLQYLFHGTDDSLIEAICEQNFDWRMCGVHGTAYGKGTLGFGSQFSHKMNLQHALLTKHKRNVCSLNVLHVVFRELLC